MPGAWNAVVLVDAVTAAKVDADDITAPGARARYGPVAVPATPPELEAGVPLQKNDSAVPELYGLKS